MATSEFKVVNEVIFLDLETAKWQKRSEVYVESFEDMPSPRMGASMVEYGNKLWVYAGADPYGPRNVVFSDFFSFDLITGLWKRQTGQFTELKLGGGSLMGQAVRIYNSDAVIFSGGCNTVT